MKNLYMVQASNTYTGNSFKAAYLPYAAGLLVAYAFTDENIKLKEHIKKLYKFTTIILLNQNIVIENRKSAVISGVNNVKSFDENEFIIDTNQSHENKLKVGDNTATITLFKKTCELKFKIVDGHLYAYNMYEAVENRKMIEVLKINNVEISQIIDKISEEDLYNIDVLKKHGINTEEEFILAMSNGDSVIDFDIFNTESDDKVFYKEHEINENITIEELEIENIGNVSQNVMLDYASTNFKSLLKILKANCLSQTDKNSISEVLTAMESTNDNYGNASNNLDMLFLSSQLLLMMEDKIDYLPENIIYTISKSGQIQFKFDGENLEDNNSAILTNGEINRFKAELGVYYYQEAKDHYILRGPREEDLEASVSSHDGNVYSEVVFKDNLIKKIFPKYGKYDATGQFIDDRYGDSG